MHVGYVQRHHAFKIAEAKKNAFSDSLSSFAEKQIIVGKLKKIAVPGISGYSGKYNFEVELLGSIESIKNFLDREKVKGKSGGIFDEPAKVKRSSNAFETFMKSHHDNRARYQYHCGEFDDELERAKEWAYGISEEDLF